MKPYTIHPCESSVIPRRAFESIGFDYPLSALLSSDYAYLHLGFGQGSWCEYEPVVRGSLATGDR